MWHFQFFREKNTSPKWRVGVNHIRAINDSASSRIRHTIPRYPKPYKTQICSKLPYSISLKFCRRVRIKNRRGSSRFKFQIASAILDLFGVLWKTLDLNSAAIFNWMFLKFGNGVEEKKFSGSFLIYEKIFINVATRWPHIFVFGQFWRVIAAILDLLKTYFFT